MWVGGRLYFAQESSYGRELFVSDGTAAGTRLLKDIAPGARSGVTQSVFAATTAAPELWFVAENGTGSPTDPEDAGRELWLSDGTSAGTRMLRDIKPGPVGGVGLAFQWFKGAGFFLVRNAAGTQVVHRSDGTAAGTGPWFDFTTAAATRSGINILAGTNRLWFSVRNATTGRFELWSSDGTAPPVTVADFATGPRFLGVAPDDRLYFSMREAATGFEVWIGSPAGASLLKDLNPGPGDSQPREFAVLPTGVVLFHTVPAAGFTPALWKSDGTPEGTVKVLDVTVSGNSFPLIVTSGSLAYFTGQPVTGADTGLEVWRTDGTAAGTFMLRDIVPGAGSGSQVPLHLVDFNGSIFFAAGDLTFWKSDGTPEGTVRAASADVTLPATANQASKPVVGGGAVYFPGVDANGAGMFRSDGTPAGTQRIFGAMAAPTGWPPRQVLAAAGDVVYFVGAAVDELWRTDGTVGGTYSLKIELSNLLVPPTFASLGSHVYFAGLPDATIRLWLARSDGTVAGTQFVKDLGSQEDGDARLLGAGAGVVHFSVTSATGGWEPWTSDGTAGGTIPAGEIFPGEESAHPGPVFEFGGAVYFVADDGPHGAELWRRAGTPATSSLFANLAPDPAGPAASHPRDFTPLGERFLFTAQSGEGSRRILWISDGTADGTTPVECAADDPTDLVALGGAVLFAAQDGRSGRELWRSDGTAAGTTLVKDIAPGPGVNASSKPSQLIAAGGRVYFTADDGVHGTELWSTDGTPTGTTLVRDIHPGPAGSDPAPLAGVGTRVAFAALDSDHGRELWVSDGTSAGTQMTEDLHPGPGDAGVNKLLPARGGVFYYGRQPGSRHPRLRFSPVSP